MSVAARSIPKIKIRMHQPRHTLLRSLEYLLLAAGLISVGFYGLSVSEGWFFQMHGSYILEQRSAGAEPTLPGFLRFLANAGWSRPQTATVEMPVLAVPSQPSVAPASVGVNGLIGRVEIPSVKVSAVVREGVDQKTLSRAVGHVPSTALPGLAGNFSIAAHRDTYFRGLRTIKKGEVIRVVTPQATFDYEVDTLKIVWPSDVSVLEATKQPSITLITCYPFDFVGSAPKRFIVQGRQIAAVARQSPTAEKPKAENGIKPRHYRAIRPRAATYSPAVTDPSAAVKCRSNPIRSGHLSE